MVRTPCCERTGLKKGPWSSEEDEILVTFIRKNGHQNWRALPKQAGLLRCGKSCRLRWINYLRPDLKRGDFSEEEEEAIFKLHGMLGNRWSAIAARLPGRTDNEIKNVWNTRLKKQLRKSKSFGRDSKSSRDTDSKFIAADRSSTRPHQCCSEASSTTGSSVCRTTMTPKDEKPDYTSEYFPRDHNYWPDEMSADDWYGVMCTTFDAAMDSWHHLFTRIGYIGDLPEF